MTPPPPSPPPPPRYDDLADAARLRRAWQRVWRTHGAFGGDGQTLGEFRADVRMEIAQLGRELIERRYRPHSLRGCRIPKSDGGERRLLIPSVRDRVVQQAALSLLGPWLEPHFETASWAYRPGRSHVMALGVLQRAWRAGYRWTAEGDVDQFFDRIDRSRLATLLEQYVPDRELVGVVMAWVGGRDGRGIPQGAPISPLLSNLYLDRFDEQVGLAGRRLIRFADDFVVATHTSGEAADALVGARQALVGLGLRLKPAKTAIRAPSEGFVFLGADVKAGTLRFPAPTPRASRPPRHWGNRGDGWDLWFPEDQRRRFRQNGDWESAPPPSREDGGRVDVPVAHRPASAVPVSALRELLYCPHAAFRVLCLGESPVTEAMRWGQEEHVAFLLAQAGAREVVVASERLGLTGRIDLLENTGRATIAVEVKSGLARTPTLADRVQVAAYALILAETTAPVRAELAFTQTRRREPVPLTPWLTTRTRLFIHQLHEIQGGHWQPANRERPACGGCHHRRACRGD